MILSHPAAKGVTLTSSVAASPGCSVRRTSTWCSCSYMQGVGVSKTGSVQIIATLIQEGSRERDERGCERQGGGKAGKMHI